MKPPWYKRRPAQAVAVAIGVLVLLSIFAALRNPDDGGAGAASPSAVASNGEPTSSAAASLPPTATPAPEFAGFDDGDHMVGTDIQAGTYRLRTPAGLCYWERLSGFGGTFEEIIANGSGSGYLTVSIAATDAGFSSSGCGHWTADLSAVTDPAGPIPDDGVYIVGTDISAGTWSSAGGAGCYIARLSGFSGAFDEIIANDVSSGASLIVTIAASDAGFETTGCGTWTKTG